MAAGAHALASVKPVFVYISQIGLCSKMSPAYRYLRYKSIQLRVTPVFKYSLRYTTSNINEF